jgi:hypothetical protein
VFSVSLTYFSSINWAKAKSVPSQTAEAATVLSNLGNTPIVDPRITNGHFEGHGFTVPAGQDYVLNSVTGA